MTHAARRRRLGELLCCASVAAVAFSLGTAVALGLGLSQEAQAQAFQGTPTITSGDASISTGAGTTDIFMNSSQTVIDWRVGGTGSGAIDFLPAGDTATFAGATPFTVLNRVLPVDPATGAAVNQAIAFNGTVNSRVGRKQGGDVWFYSPGGIIAGPTAVFNVGSLVLTSSAIDTTGGLYGPNGEIRFSGVANGASSVEIRPGAQINAANSATGSYVALVAPRIVQGGTVSADGSIAYVAAEQADITINNGLFDIDIGAGTDDPNGVVHTGVTGGPATTSTADVQRIYMVAVPKNDALTMLLSGTIGYAPAITAVNEAGAVVLSAGTGVAGGAAEVEDGATSDAGIAISDADFTSALTGYATNGIAVSADDDQVRFEAATSLTARNSVAVDLVNGGKIDALGGLSLIAGHGATGGTIDVSVDGTGGVQSLPSTFTVNGQLLLDASAAGAIDDTPGATGENATGGTVTLTATNGGTLSADSLVANARAIGGFGAAREGDATGGTVTIAGNTGGVISAGSLDVDASAFAQDQSPNGGASLIGGSATAGTIKLTSTDSALSFDATTLLAEAYGGVGSQTSGNAVGGTVAMSVSGADNYWGSLGVNAGANPGSADGAGVAGAGSGSAQGITLDVGNDATLTLTDANLLANASVVTGSSGTGGGGNVIRGGTIGVTAHDGGALAVDGVLDLSATGYGYKYNSDQDTGAPMTVFGGSVSIDANGGDITAAYLEADASAQASGANGSRGSATGGTVTVAARNAGSLSLTGDQSSFVDANARGGYGGYGADATGGTVNLYASDGTIDVAQALFLEANASSGGSFNDGVAGGAATGGSITVENRVGSTGSASMTFGALDIESSGDASAFTEGPFYSGGDGGRGQGGTVAIDLLAGVFNAGSLQAVAPGYGGSAMPGYVGGDGVGGDLSLTLDGATAAIDELYMDASGEGGFADSDVTPPEAPSPAGNGIGGNVLVSALSGALTGSDLYLTADGYGGAGDAYYASSANGGEGIGGTARFAMPATSGATVDLSGLYIDASGTGGYAGSYYETPDAAGPFPPAGRGGDAQGGSASAAIDGGILMLDTLTLAANGAGADGGYSNDGDIDAGNGGDGLGGTAALSFGSSAATIGTIETSATGRGGVGGITGTVVGYDGETPIYQFGSGRGGDGGIGVGGTVDLTFGADPTLASLIIDASGAGGLGGDGGSGGAGGIGTGGSAGLTLNAGPLIVNDVLNLNATGLGGDGGVGATGAGGDGGAAGGGAATLSVDGAATTLQATGLTISAEAQGGAGGAGGDGSAAIGGAAGGDATGGSATLMATNGAAISFSDMLAVSAVATGGAGHDGNGGGAGGVGGNALGGTALASLDHATLTDTDLTGQGVTALVTAEAIGGAGGEGSIGAVVGAGGAGGTGTGGSASFSAADSNFVLGAFGDYANGFGGAGGAGAIDDSANPFQGPAGVGGGGRGGQASLSVTDDGSGGPSPAMRALASVDIAATGADGLSPDLGSGTGVITGVAGKVALTNAIVGATGGLAIAGDLTATAYGASAPAGSGVSFAASGAPLTVGGNAIFGTDGDITFAFSGAGTLAAQGDFVASAARSISLNHISQTSAPSDSIRAANIVLDARRNVTGDRASVLHATDPSGYVIVRGGGSVAIGSAIAPTDVTLSAFGGSLTASDVTAGDDVWLGAYGGDPAASVTIGDIVSTGKGSDIAVTDEELFGAGGTGPSGQIVRVTGPGSITTGAIDTPTGRTVVLADQGSIFTGDLDAADGIALLARGAVTTGAVTTPSLFYVGDSSLFGPNLPDAYDVTVLAGVAPARTSGGLTMGGSVSVGQLIATVGGDANFAAVATTGTATIDSTGKVTGNSLNGGEAVTLTGVDGIALADLHSGGDVTLRAPSGAAIVSHDLTATGTIDAVARAIDLTALGDLTVATGQATGGELAITSGGALTLTAGSATGAITLVGDDGVTGQTVMAGGNASFTSDSGAVTLASLTAGGKVSAHGRSVALTSPGALDIATIAATGGGIAVTTSGALNVGTGTATGAVALRSGGDLSAQAVSAGGDVDLTSDGGIAVTGLSAGGQVTARGTSIALASPDALSVVSATATAGDLSITTRGALTLANATASGDVALAGDGGVAAQTVAAGDDASFSSTNGAVTVASLTADGQVSASGVSVDLTSPGALTVTSARATGGDLAIATGGALAVTTGAASGALLLASGGALTGQTLSAGGDAELTSGDNLAIADLTAGGKITASADAIDIASSGALNFASVKATAGDLAITTRGLLTIANGTASGDVDLAGGGGIAAQTLTAAGDVALASSGGAVSASGLTAGGAVTASGTSVALASTGALDVASAKATSGDLAITAGGTLTLANGTASGNVALTGNGGVAGQTVSAGGDASFVSANGAVTAASLTAGGQVSASGASVALTSPGALAVASVKATAGNLAITTGGDLVIASGAASGAIRLVSSRGIDADALTAGGDASLDSSGATDAVTVAALRAGGQVEASGGSIHLASPGALTVSSARATSGVLEIAADDGLAVNAANSAGDMSLASDAGDVAAQTLASGGDVGVAAFGNSTVSKVIARTGLTVQAGKVASFLGVATAPTIDVASGDIAIADGARLGDLATTDNVTLTSTNTGSAAIIGGDGSGGGYNLSAAEIGRIFAQNIGITAAQLTRGDALGAVTPPDVIVRDLTVAGGTNLAADGTFAVTTSGKMRVEGAIALTGLAADGALQLAANDAIELIAGAGSIALSDADGKLGGTLDLSGGSFIAATDDAIADVAAATTIADRDARLAQNDGLALDEGMIRAGTIRLSVRDGAYIQNSGAGADYDQRRGFTANALDIETEGSRTQLVLNGQLSDVGASSGYVRGLETIPLVTINGLAPASGGLFDAGSTVNGCAIASAAQCSAGATVEIGGVPSYSEIEGQTSPAGPNSAQLTPTSLIMIQPFQQSGYPPLIDEPVTGVGNDDLWISKCPAGQDGAPCPADQDK